MTAGCAENIDVLLPVKCRLFSITFKITHSMSILCSFGDAVVLSLSNANTVESRIILLVA